MTGPARSAALAAVLVTLALWATPATASAGVAGTVCSLAGFLSGVAGKVCDVASNPGRVIDAGKKLASGHVGGAIGALAGSGPARAVARTAGLTALVAAIIGGAQYALKLTATAIGGTTTPDLGSTWFSASYWRMAAVAALLTVPFLFAAAIQALLRSDLSLLARSAFGYLPVGLLGVGVAAPLTALLLAGSDEMSAIISSASGHAGAGFLDRVGGLGGLISAGSGSLFVTFFVALFTIAAVVTLWLELLIRQAAVYVVVLMLPLFFAAMVWPARRIWAMRAVELLVALILSKFAIVAVLGLGGAALGHTIVPGVGSLLAGTTLVLLAAFSPWALLRLLPLHELAGAAVGGLRPHAAQPLQATDARAHGATDASEEAVSEEVATEHRARLRTVMAGDDETDAAAAATARAVAPERGAGGGGEPGRAASEPPPGATGSPGPPTGPEAPPTELAAPPREPAATAPDGGGAAGEPATPPGEPASPLPGHARAVGAPETDVFGPTAPRGPLPPAIQALGAGADVFHLEHPRLDTADGPLPPLPAPPEPEVDPL